MAESERPVARQRGADVHGGDTVCHAIDELDVLVVERGLGGGGDARRWLVAHGWLIWR